MLSSLLEVYAAELVAEAAAHERGWLLHAQDTPQEKAVRIAVKTHELIMAGNLDMLQLHSPAWQRTCSKLKIEPTVTGLTVWLLEH